MSRNRTLTTDEERRAFERFLVAHSGLPELRLAGDGAIPQCDRHPPISAMTYPQLLDVMREELGFAPSRMTVFTACEELGIPRRRPQPNDPEEEREARSERHRRWREKLRQDPEAWEAYLESKRVAGRKARERLKMDEAAYQAFLERRREYLRDYRRRQREAAAAG